MTTTTRDVASVARGGAAAGDERFSAWRVRGAPTPGGTLVFLCGLGLLPDAPVPAARLLSRSFGSVVLPLPVFGETGRGTRELGPHASAHRVVRRLTALGATRAVLVGHSASCQVAVEVARLRPDLVGGLVLLGPTTDPRGATWPRLISRFARTAVHETPRQIPVLAHSYPRTGIAAFVRAMNGARRHDIRAALAGVTVPVLVVTGPYDRIAPADWIAAVAAAAPDGRAVLLPIGAHMLPLTDPRPLVEVLEPFLRGLPDGGAVSA